MSAALTGSRRRLPATRYRIAIGTVAALTASLAMFWPAPAFGAESALSPQPATKVEHFIAVMQENHTFDNYFGTYPGANGFPPGTCMAINPAKPSKGCQPPYNLAGQGIQDLPHDVKTFKRQYDGGNMDGFIHAVDRSGSNGRQAMGYYDDSSIPYYWNLADKYVLFDRFFSSSQGGSLENHLFWVTGTGGTHHQPKQGVGYRGGPPTIFDELQAAGVSWKFYVQNYDPTINYKNPVPKDNPNRGSQVVWNPLLNYPRFVNNPDLSSHIVDASQYFVDLRKNQLPQVAYIVPSGASEHPPGSVEAGQEWVRSLINALMMSTSWDSSAFLLMYDDWGGWYDHVKPRQVDNQGYGFRVPAILVSSFAKVGFIDHTRYDFASVLKFIEDNYGLDPLATRDARANTFEAGLDGPFDFSLHRSPAIVSLSRGGGGQPTGPPEIVFFGFYGFGLLLGVATILIAFVTVLRRRSLAVVRRLPGRGGPST